jgi:acetyl esterase/lipase
VSHIPSAPLRVLLLGWHDATPRHLRAVARLYEPLGHVVHPVVTSSGRSLARRGGFADEGRRQADALSRAHELSPRPLLVHSFSNAGFWTLAAILEALDEHPFVRDAHVGTILDSAPGFPEDFGASFTARTAPMAFLPGLLARAGRAPTHTHPLWSPVLGALFGLWHLAAPSQIAFMRRALRTVREAHTPRVDRAARPVLALWGGADRLVAREHVEAFLERSEAEGVPVERLFFEQSEHVRHLVTHRAVYEKAVRAFAARVGAPSDADLRR